MIAQYIGLGTGAAAIAGRVEEAISAGRLPPGDRLPTVRDLAAQLEVSPATVASAYRTLRERGLVSANRRRGTIVAIRPPLRGRGVQPLPRGVRDLARGNPDPALLPPLAPAVARIDTGHKLYGGEAKLQALVELAEAEFAADGVRGEIGIVGGALDGLERALQTRLRPGDRVVVEDPSWPRITDLLHALGLVADPVAVDEGGPLPEALERALRRGARAVIATPRGQNPTGAALEPERGGRLREVLGRYRDVLVVEDDYVAAVAGAAYVPLHDASPHWMVIRSLSKVLGPDLRIALVTGDPLTTRRIEGRQLLGPGWVSHLLQRVAAELLASEATTSLLARAERIYAERREALVEALAGHGIRSQGRSGLGVWVPLAGETETVQLLLERGWAVSPGERYRFDTPPGIRITTTDLEPAEAGELAAALAEVTASGTETYAG